MHLSRWKFVALWQLTGMACALGVGAVMAFITNVRHGIGIQDSALLVPGDLAYVMAGVVLIAPLSLLIAPLSLLILWGWMLARAKYPPLEGTFLRAIVHLTGCALVLAVAAGAISNWEALRFDSAGKTFLEDTISVTRSVLLWAIVGIVLPRVLVRPLRPRSLAP